MNKNLRSYESGEIKQDKPKNTIKKLLSPDEKWDIFISFFKKNPIKKSILVDKPSKSITMFFDNKLDAENFSKKPSDGILGFSRLYLNENGKKFTDYDIFFNISVTYDASSTKNSKSEYIVVVRLA